jgi:hypothetical protein
MLRDNGRVICARWIIVGNFISLVASTAIAADTPADRHFLDQVKPLLDSRCISCHGPEKQKGNLRLDSRAAILKGGDGGPGIVPGKPADSLILQAVTHKRADLEMPPKEKLTPKDVAVLERWIRDGAPWPESPVGAIAAPTRLSKERIGDAWSDKRNPIVRIFGGQRLDLWSLKPIVRPSVPNDPEDSWSRNGIDHFVIAKLNSAGLTPAPAADKHTLIRRLSYDLTGLPPSAAEVDTFVKDTSPDAYERLVDRLLASPRYGEHWARQWLDVIRYSDSNGFDWDEFRPQAWRFRDYVVRSLNADKPFDQFVREQLAGDELLNGPPKNQADQDCLIATGYLRLGPHDNSAPAFGEQARSRAELMADLTETTSSAFLGLTMSCCRCHDHKYDPLSQADHYRLRAFFEPVRFADDLPIDLAPEQERIRAQHAEIDAKIAPLKKQVEALPKEQKKEIDALKKQIAELEKQKRPFTRALLMTDDPARRSAATKIFFQGDYKQERDAVEPGFPSIFDPNPADITKPPNPNTIGRRLELAEWIVSLRNPLTKRVLVNRIWQGHFGRGLVATPNDFGLAGARPTHPELLDYLAVEFVRENYSLKKLHRMIVTSATYRQASSPVKPEFAKIDEKNDLLWRQNLRRLSAEQLRDSMLSVSGLLRERPDGGPPIWPELPAEILQANPAFLDDNAEKTKGWYPSRKEDQYFRSLYLVQKRTVRVPFLETFDLPENATSCPRRNESTVAPQALSMMNSSQTADAAKALAARVEKEAGVDPAKQVTAAFQIVLQRSPEAAEQKACQELLRKRSLPELCRVLLNLNEFVYVD